MTKRQKHAILARRLRNAADRLHKRDRKAWANDPDMLVYVDGNHHDLILVARALRLGKCELAARHMHHLDTSAKEDIPQTVWDYLDRYY